MSFDQGGTVPTYHYRCKNCGYDFTEQQSFEDDPITVCPQCGQEQVRKVYSAVPIEFKGHGFYRTTGAAAPANKQLPLARSPSSGGQCSARACATRPRCG